MPQLSTSTKIAPPRPGVRSDVSYFRDLRKLSVPNMVEQNPRLDTLAPETKTALPCVLNTNVDQPESLNTALTGGQMRNLITCKSKASSAPTGMELRKLVISKTRDNILECHQSEAADKNTMMPEPSFFVSPHDSNPKCDPMMPIDLAVQVQSRLARKNRSENKENDKVLNKIHSKCCSFLAYSVQHDLLEAETKMVNKETKNHMKGYDYKQHLI